MFDDSFVSQPANDREEAAHPRRRGLVSHDPNGSPGHTTSVMVLL